MGFCLGKMSDTLLDKIKNLKKREQEISEELKKEEQRKEEEKKNLQSELQSTIKELLLEEKKKFEETQKKDSIDKFIQDTPNPQEDPNNPANMQTIENSLYSSIKSVTQKPYELWSQNEKDFVENVSYQVSKLKNNYLSSQDDELVRVESLLKKDYDQLYRV